MDQESPDKSEERPFSQAELKRAYAQIVAERGEDRKAAESAAVQLKMRIQQNVQVECGMLWCMDRFHQHITPEPSLFTLMLYLCDYDDWQAIIARLQEAGVEMKPWDGTYKTMPVGSWQAPNGRTYGVRIQYYNSHAGECTT